MVTPDLIERLRKMGDVLDNEGPGWHAMACDVREAADALARQGAGLVEIDKDPDLVLHGALSDLLRAENSIAFDMARRAMVIHKIHDLYRARFGQRPGSADAVIEAVKVWRIFYGKVTSNSHPACERLCNAIDAHLSAPVGGGTDTLASEELLRIAKMTFWEAYKQSDPDYFSAAINAGIKAVVTLSERCE